MKIIFLNSINPSNNNSISMKANRAKSPYRDDSTSYNYSHLAKSCTVGAMVGVGSFIVNLIKKIPTKKNLITSLELGAVTAIPILIVLLGIDAVKRLKNSDVITNRQAK